jgi:hypothetical protein
VLDVSLRLLSVQVARHVEGLLGAAVGSGIGANGSHGDTRDRSDF